VRETGGSLTGRLRWAGWSCILASELAPALEEGGGEGVTDASSTMVEEEETPAGKSTERGTGSAWDSEDAGWVEEGE